MHDSTVVMAFWRSSRKEEAPAQIWVVARYAKCLRGVQGYFHLLRVCCLAHNRRIHLDRSITDVQELHETS